MGMLVSGQAASIELKQTFLYSPPSKKKNSILVVFIGISFSINEVGHLKLQLYLSTGFCNTAIAIDLAGLVVVARRRDSPI